jgi:hypothetical protein
MILNSLDDATVELARGCTYSYAVAIVSESQLSRNLVWGLTRFQGFEANRAPEQTLEPG